jgi:hypothetical protein
MIEEKKSRKARPESTSMTMEEDLNKLESQFNEFDDQVKKLTLDRMNEAPKRQHEPENQLSQKQISESKDIYLKPNRIQFSKEKFNERFRSDWEFQKEYVYFTAYNNESKGLIEMWTKPFPGVPCEEWLVPTNKPLWAPRYVAEQIKKASYHKLIIDENQATGTQNSVGYDTGRVVVDEVVQRLDAVPATKKRSIFLSSTGF